MLIFNIVICIIISLIFLALSIGLIWVIYATLKEKEYDALFLQIVFLIPFICISFVFGNIAYDYIKIRTDPIKYEQWLSRDRSSSGSRDDRRVVPIFIPMHIGR